MAPMPTRSPPDPEIPEVRAVEECTGGKCCRPGTGKRRPLIFDLANHPDDVFAAISRFWGETHHYEGHLGEVKDVAMEMKMST